MVFYFLRPSLRQVYTDPKLRWWEHSKRYVSSYNAAFTYKEVRGDGQIVNLSKTGLLLKTNIELTNYSHIDLLVDIGDEKLPITGEVIVHEQIKNGFGIKFDKTSANKTSAKKIIKKLKNNQPIP